MYNSKDNLIFYNSSEPNDILIHNYSLKSNSFEKGKDADDFAVSFFIRLNGLPIVNSKSIWYIKALDNHLSNITIVRL
jgi:hypothetical protein